MTAGNTVNLALIGTGAWSGSVGDVMVNSTTSGDYSINHLSLDQFFKHASCSGSDNIPGERQEFDTLVIIDHCLQNVNRHSQLTRCEPPSFLHLEHKLID